MFQTQPGFPPTEVPYGFFYGLICLVVSGTGEKKMKTKKKANCNIQGIPTPCHLGHIVPVGCIFLMGYEGFSNLFPYVLIHWKTGNYSQEIYNLHYFFHIGFERLKISF